MKIKNIKHRTASEFFGRNPLNNNQINLIKSIKGSGYECPFIRRKCKKQSRLINYPMGVCSVFNNDTPVIICPQRFDQEQIVLKNVAQQFMGGTKNTLSFPEVKLKNIGTFDYVLLRHKELSPKIEDFTIIEIQSDSTTGTGKLVNNLTDFLDGKAYTIKKRYAFGMNTYNTIKLSFIQMLNKGMIAEKWDKNIIWVMQDFIFKNMLKRFEIIDNKFSEKKRNHFFIYTFKKAGSEYKLVLDSRHSFTVEELAEAFSSARSLPDIDKFIEKLEQKVRIQLSITTK